MDKKQICVSCAVSSHNAESDTITHAVLSPIFKETAIKE